MSSIAQNSKEYGLQKFVTECKERERKATEELRQQRQRASESKQREREERERLEQREQRERERVEQREREQREQEIEKEKYIKKIDVLTTNANIDRYNKAYQEWINKDENKSFLDFFEEGETELSEDFLKTKTIDNLKILSNLILGLGIFRINYESDRENEAAVKIQSGSRSYLARNKVNKLRQEAQKKEEEAAADLRKQAKQLKEKADVLENNISDIKKIYDNIDSDKIKKDYVDVGTKKENLDNEYCIEYCPIIKKLVSQKDFINDNKKEDEKLEEIYKFIKAVELWQTADYITRSDDSRDRKLHYKIIIREGYDAKKNKCSEDEDKENPCLISYIMFVDNLKTIKQFEDEDKEYFLTSLKKELLKGAKYTELTDSDTIDKIDEIIESEKVNEKARKFLQSQEKKITKIKSSGLPCDTIIGKSGCESAINPSDKLRKCEYEPGGPCTEIKGKKGKYTAEERRKLLTYQYSEEQEIKKKGWLKFDKLEQGESYLPVQNGLSGPLMKIPYNIEYAVHVFKKGYYFDGQYKEKSVLDMMYEKGILSIPIQWGNRSNRPISIIVNNIFFSTLDGLGLFKTEDITKFQEKARQAAIDKGAIDKVKTVENVVMGQAEEIYDGQTGNKEALDQKLKDLKQKHVQEIERLNVKHKEDLQNLGTIDTAKFNEAGEKHKKELEQAEQKHKEALTNLQNTARTDKTTLENKLNQIQTQRKELEKKLKKAEDSKQDEETTERQIKRLEEAEKSSKESIKKHNIVIQQLKQQKAEIEATMTENEKLFIQMKKEKKEAKRRRMKEFLKGTGKALKEAIGKLEKDGKFTNMSEIKIDALEEEKYDVLRKKIINFLVFKEDELIKAHHAKMYSDIIKINNNKLLETLTLFPSEPFLGIEGLPLVAAFGTTPEKEETKPKEEEKEINLKEIKKKVRDFIIRQAKFIFNHKEHEKLSVKEYLKTL